MLILASASPWRARLLKEAGFEFEVMPTDIDEETDMRAIHDPETLVKTLAEKKAHACLASLSTNHQPLGTVILAADTIVWAHSQIIGKPVDRADARRIIKLLSGTTHQVWTGICIAHLRGDPPNWRSSSDDVLFAEKSDVTFRALTDEELETYLDTNDWVGKAGAYQLQLNISKFVTKIVGDRDNIIGLPQRTYRFL